MRFFYLIFLFLILSSSTSYGLQAKVSWTNNWTADNPATQNVIKRGPHGAVFTDIFYAQPTDSIFLDTTIKEGTVYDWQVFAGNSIGLSDGSNIVCSTFYNGLIPVFPPIALITGPSVNITAPVASVVGIQWQIDGINYGTENITFPFNLTITDSTIFTNGVHLLTAIMRNSDGTLTTAQQQVTIQNAIVPTIWYAMNEGTGTMINDSSGHNNNGIGNGLVWNAPGANNTPFALSFLSGGKINTNYSKHNNIRSYLIWTKRTGPGGGNFGRIFDKRTSGTEVELLYNDEAAKVYRFARVWSNGIGSWNIPQPPLNEWHHIAVVYNSSSPLNNPRIYLDGVQQVVNQVTIPAGSPSINTDPYVLGNRNAGDRTWSGILDNFKMYDIDISDIAGNM